MLKKSLVITFVTIILSLCCTVSFAVENGNKINLGNEIVKSIDKTGDSMQNVISGNVVKDAQNMVDREKNMITDGAKNVENTVTGTINNIDNNIRNNSFTDALETKNNGNYNTTRTTAAQTINNGINTMDATTWMWIILIVAAVTIMMAIWYYATQDNNR